MENPERTAHAATSEAVDALKAADLRVLLMVLYHLTGDGRWLEPPFTPVRDVRLIADPTAGFDESTASEIRNAVGALISEGSTDAVVDDSGAELQRMMSVCLGEDVPVEYVPMMADEMGFARCDPEWTNGAPHRDGAGVLDVVVIGAGVSGVCLARNLRRLGFSFRVLEKNADIGGTWFENRYPGCGVDTPNHFYSYSFAPNHGWTRYFSRRDEILAYLQACARDFGIESSIECATEVTGATWDEARLHWNVSVRSERGDQSIAARTVVSAVGHFSQPSESTIAGIDKFDGPIFHSARWPNDVDLTGKRVAVIGTGASSMQIVPSIVDSVSELFIVQRTPQWVRPVAEYREHVQPGSSWLFANLPYYERWYRFTQSWRYGDGLLQFLRRDPDWPHPDRSVNRVNDRHRAEMTGYITSKLAERPDLVDDCVPSYPPFGKRILIDNGWYDALVQPHVELVTAPIETLEPNGVEVAGGRHIDVDAVILATGFNVTSLCARLDIVGVDGRRLADDWADDNPTAHLGMTVPGFPNFFCMFGPNTNMGHGGSAIFLAEAQTRYITDALVQLDERGAVAMDCRPEVRADYVAHVDALHAELIWTHPGMSTYYRNRHGRVVSTMPFRLVDYWTMTREANLDDYSLTFPTSSPAPSKSPS